MKFTTAAVLAAAASAVGAGWGTSQQMVERLRGLTAGKANSHLLKRDYGAPSDANHKYYNDKTSKFWVNTSIGALPEVDFETSESYSGLMPISADKNETRQLFFWFWPTTGGKETEDDIVIWLNGGPGCSSLEGFLQENGPISWKEGTKKPVKNPYSWTNLTNMIWVEQPVGTGFSQGEPNIKNEEELVVQFLGFWKQFMDTFEGLKGKRIWVTGESYAGYYVPYITNGFYNAKDKDYYNAQGLMINDPVIDGGPWLHWEVPVYPFAEHWKDLLALDDATITKLKDMYTKCGYEQMYNDAMTFPPKGPIQVPAQLNDANGIDACEMSGFLSDAIILKNPCFNVYEISTTCPSLYDPLDFGGNSGEKAYFARRDVQDAIHAPHIDWSECSNGKPVFVGGPNNTWDESEGSSLKQIPECIEKSKRVVIANGDLDFILMSNGTLMAIQNMTWGGQQGFQQQPSKRIVVEYEGQGDMGTWAEERGLTWAQVKLSGHMLPGYQPGAGYMLLQYLLGHIDSLTGSANATITAPSPPSGSSTFGGNDAGHNFGPRRDNYRSSMRRYSN